METERSKAKVIIIASVHKEAVGKQLIHVGFELVAVLHKVMTFFVGIRTTYDAGILFVIKIT